MTTADLAIWPSRTVLQSTRARSASAPLEKCACCSFCDGGCNETSRLTPCCVQGDAGQSTRPDTSVLESYWQQVRCGLCAWSCLTVRCHLTYGELALLDADWRRAKPGLSRRPRSSRKYVGGTSQALVRSPSSCEAPRGDVPGAEAAAW